MTRQRNSASANGLFFEKRSQPREGRFFEKMSGREDGAFHEKFASDGMGDKDPKATEATKTTETGTTGKPPGNAGENMGGGMYLGTGEGAKDAKCAKKEASRSPSDWDTASDMPTGFHRPAGEQPEALEAGGERFHSTETKGPDYGVGDGVPHGVIEGGSMKMKGTTGSQMGKHATPRFLGTSQALGKEAGFAEDRGSEFKGSVKKGVKGVGDAVGEGVKSITRSPAASIVAAVLLGRLGARGLRSAAKAAKKGAKRIKHGPKVEPEPKSLVEKFIGGARSAGEKLKVTTK